MANIHERLPENVPGDFFVDATCIDCDTCSQLAPDSFPRSRRAVQRLSPTGQRRRHTPCIDGAGCLSHRLDWHHRKHDARIGIDAFPSPVAENVYFCGFTSESSFGGWSYLIVRPESDGGNILIDSPRFATQLVKRIEKLGGVRQMLLTHRDDIADHELFRKKFACERIMHADDGAARIGVERTIKGEDAIELETDFAGYSYARPHARPRWSFSTSRSFSSPVTTSPGRPARQSLTRVSERGLVFVDQANGVNGETARL